MLEKRLATNDKYAIQPIDSMQLTLLHPNPSASSSPLKRKLAKGHTRVGGRFPTTLRDGDLLLPPESQHACFELILSDPAMLMDATSQFPRVRVRGRGEALVVLLPGTGEHGCTHRRRAIAEPLARAGVSTLVLEGAFYGQRKPTTQKGSKLRRVSDLPILGMATIEETKSLLWWAKQEWGFEHVVVAGGSMGGLHAAMAASLSPMDVGVASWIAPPSAIPPFTRGLLSQSCNWTSLQRDRDDLALIDILLANHTNNQFDSSDTGPSQQHDVKARLAAFLALTNLENFPPPRRPDAVIFAHATEDQYVGANAQQWEMLRRRWHGAQFQHVKAGHVSGILFETQAFLATINDVLKQLKQPPIAIAPTIVPAVATTPPVAMDRT
ncbi:hypothetical protein, variant [Aphanomyces invadans]|nr:hypothetical protein, variant [Aphanomyces invadans]ETV94285.1 hypothetical protein, variant [Aphanomyces invadans]|eukprot:XP_008877046.1 hypothetical protein, variant [Aphanomyces invadans]